MQRPSISEMKCLSISLFERAATILSSKRQIPGLLGLSSFVLFMALFSALTAQGDEPPKALQEMDLCALQRDFSFFTQKAEKRGSSPSETVPCEDLLATADALKVAESTVADETALFAEELLKIVAGSPMEAMVPTIATFDREIAGLIIGIGKKESSWGLRTPKSAHGAECFNFWGYRGPGDLGLTPSGYGCFSTPAQAVEKIGGRLEELKKLRASTSPARMIVWKCGSTCEGHSPESVRKWISDVNLYYQKIAKD